MAGEGRESKKDNDLFYTCSLIDYIARKTKNTRADVVNKLGKQRIDKIYDLADIYHCDNIDRVSDDFIEEAGIKEGDFDNVGDCKYSIPSHWDIGKVKIVGIKDGIIEAVIYNMYTFPKGVLHYKMSEHGKTKSGRINEIRTFRISEEYKCVSTTLVDYKEAERKRTDGNKKSSFMVPNWDLE